MFTTSFATLGAALAALLSPLHPVHAQAVTASPGTVVGIVVDGHGDPVAGALVHTLDSREVPESGVLPPHDADRAVLTDAAGHFSLRQPTTGYLLQVCVPTPVQGGGHRAARLEDPTCAETVSNGGAAFAITYDGPDGTTDSWLLQHRLRAVSAGEYDAGTITVKPVGAVHGRIIGAANQTVSIMRLNDTTAFRMGADGMGRYRIPGMVPGTYYLAAGGDGTLPWRSSDFTITAGGDRVVNGRLDPGASLIGQARSDGQPARADIFALLDGRPVAATSTDADGRFRFSGLRRGTYRVGIPRPDGTWLRHTAAVKVHGSRHIAVVGTISLTRGATVSITYDTSKQGQHALVDELRDRRGVPVALRLNDGTGHATYTGLAPGTYHAVGAFGGRYGTATVRVTEALRPVRATVRIDRPTLTLRGRTAPGAGVALTDAGSCPPSAEPRFGAFFASARAGKDGRYVIRDVVPGRYLLRAQKQPSYAPRCRPDVTVTANRAIDLPLQRAAHVTGRFVYAGTTRPLITELSYQLAYAHPSPMDPTGEEPSVGRSAGSTGRFRIDGLRQGRITGSLATETGENITDEQYVVVFPFQDGTPYWYDVAPRTFDAPAPGHTLDLGDVGLRLH